VLISVRDLQSIAAGRVSVAFRRWIRPTVKSGGTLRTALGVLEIQSVEPVSEAELSSSDAKAAGFADVDALLAALSKRAAGSLYRVRLAFQGTDPRASLRDKAELPLHELQQPCARLHRLDSSSKPGPWTWQALRAIQAKPGHRAADLAAELGLEKEWLKVSVRKLKALGLTESLEVGYRVSLRGQSLLAHAQRRDA